MNNKIYAILYYSLILGILLSTVNCQPQQESAAGTQDPEIFPGITDTTVQLPQGFVQKRVISGLDSPSTMTFSPEGNLLIDERIQGDIRVLTQDGTLLPEPMLTLDVPKDENGVPVRHHNAGIGSFIYDPEYPDEPYLYVSYMYDEPRHNRVSRFRISEDNPNHVVEGSEEVLLELPFNDMGTAGSNNGLALIFGEDGYLYVTTGDGRPAHDPWPAGDPVQSLETFTGKVFRIKKDGSIPETNPFYDETSGDFRAIYALGLRNPYTISKHPVSGNIYLNDISLAWGYTDKDHIYRLEAGANYMWDGDVGNPEDPVGTPREPLALSGPRVISGGAWYPQDGYFPVEYRGSYFVAVWGPNALCQGSIVRMASETNTEFEPFLCLSGDGMNGNGTPVFTRIGPDGDLYWLATTYETGNGSVFKISYSESSGSL